MLRWFLSIGFVILLVSVAIFVVPYFSSGEEKALKDQQQDTEIQKLARENGELKGYIRTTMRGTRDAQIQQTDLKGYIRTAMHGTRDAQVQQNDLKTYLVTNSRAVRGLQKESTSVKGLILASANGVRDLQISRNTTTTRQGEITDELDTFRKNQDDLTKRVAKAEDDIVKRLEPKNSQQIIDDLYKATTTAQNTASAAAAQASANRFIVRHRVVGADHYTIQDTRSSAVGGRAIKVGPAEWYKVYKDGRIQAYIHLWALNGGNRPYYTGLGQWRDVERVDAICVKYPGFNKLGYDDTIQVTVAEGFPITFQAEAWEEAVAQ